jgi:hypothetical protein
MKIFFATLSCLLFLQNPSYANPNDWMPYVPNVPVTNYQSPTFVETQQTIVTTIRPAPVVVYNWVPVYVNQPVVYEKYSIFCRQRIVAQQPVIYWVYRPTAY